MSISQNQRVLEYIEEHGSITQLEALQDLGVMRLASRISDLRRCGIPIKKEMQKSKNRYGEPVRFASYSFDNN